MPRVQGGVVVAAAVMARGGVSRVLGRTVDREQDAANCQERRLAIDEHVAEFLSATVKIMKVRRGCLVPTWCPCS